MPRKRPRTTPARTTKKGLPFQELVGSVAKAFDPTAEVKTEQWVVGPDGRRDMDVHVRGTLEGAPFRLLIECKDYDPKTTGRVGIQHVDALDSKRHDLDVHAAMICSNSGFTEDAVRKAKRKHIGLISILKAGDPRVKAVIEEEIFTRHVKVGTINTTFHGDCPTVSGMDLITFRGLPVLNWVMNRIAMIVVANPTGTANLLATHRFNAPVEFHFGEQPALIHGLDIRFPVETKWFSQTVTIDASLGMYDYIRGKVRLAPGESKYTINGVDIYDGKPLDFIPRGDELGAGLLPGEVGINLMLVDGLQMADAASVPALDPFIAPEDLEWKLSSAQSNAAPLGA